MKMLWKLLLIIPALYLGVVLFMFIFQRSMMYYPSPLTEMQRLNPWMFDEISVTAEDGLTMKSWIMTGEPDKETIVFFHGNAGNAADRIPFMLHFVNEGHTLVLAEYRGFGDNPGAPNETDIISDAERLMDHLISSGTPETDIVVMGRSLGTGIATNLATKYDVAALALVSPYSSFPDVAANVYPYIPVRLLMHDQFDNKSIIKNVSAPVIMVHGDLDRVIPIHFGEALFEAANEPKTFETLPGRGHNNLDMDQINSQILDFIQENT